MIALRFCRHCGGSLTRRLVEDRQRAICDACGWIEFEQLKVGAAAVITRNSHLLLVRRTTEPFLGQWSLPAGYVEVDEHPEAAMRRETREEIGLEVEPHGLLGVFFFDDDPRGNGILIAYECSPLGDPRRSSEVEDPTFFGSNAIPAEVAGAGHDQAVRAWVSRLPREHS